MKCILRFIRFLIVSDKTIQLGLQRIKELYLVQFQELVLDDIFANLFSSLSNRRCFPFIQLSPNGLIYDKTEDSRKWSSFLVTLSSRWWRWNEERIFRRSSIESYKSKKRKWFVCKDLWRQYNCTHKQQPKTVRVKWAETFLLQMYPSWSLR